MMDSLRTFMDEMLDDQGRKEGFISDLLANLKWIRMAASKKTA